MSILSGLKSGSDVESNDGDVLGGGYTLETGVYPMTIETAHVIKSAKGAMGIAFAFKHGQQNMQETIYVTSGDAKGNRNYYEKDGKKFDLPGLSMANAIAFVTLGKDIGDLDTEVKTMNVYNYDAQAEVPTQVDMIMDLLGQDLVLGVQKRIEDKNVKGDNGVYVPSPTGETRQKNEIKKVFQASTNLTVSEIKAGETNGEFMQKWSDKWTGVTQDTSSKKPAGVGAGAPGASAASPTGSLFPSA